MIELQNITKSFGDRNVVENVSFKFYEGKTNLVIGESGSGKTTLLKVMVGLHQPNSGAVLYDGRDFTALAEKEKQGVRKEIGMLFQGGALFDSMTLEQNVRFPLDMFTELTEAEKIDRVNFCLEKVKLVDKNALYPSELSGGMKKRAALARAISNSPNYLFCDEPNSGLDPKTSIVIDELIHDITAEFNITTVIITHDMNSVMEIGENVMFIHKGQNWWTGTKDEILKTNNKELYDFVFASQFIKKIYSEKS
ncbi:MAG: ATP-binding cassette domain-containing protein [Sphingobacteriaceae bacterium]|nr:ATP-binding cassette domain-containing protein [Sphingobacteriaceae bacterium]